MTLPWIRLETSFPTNPKVLELMHRKASRAVVAYVSSLAYCGASQSDGYIPAHALAFIHADRKTAEQLVDVGLWHAFGDGWLVPDWADYQPTKASLDQSRERSRRAVCDRWMRKGKPCSCGTH